MSRRVLRSPLAWAIGCAIALLVALVLPPQAPDLAFWGAVAVSCACAVGYVVLEPDEA